MRLEKPQDKAVEQILTDCYKAGQDSMASAARDYFTDMVKNKTMFEDFYRWYLANQDDYKMTFKVKE